MSAILALWERDIVRFFRDKPRVIGGLVPPIVFWLLIGAGLGTSVHVPGAPEGMSFLQYFYAGTLVLIVLFTSIFATISIIEDRHEGFLQAVLVSPVPRLSIVLGKVLGASTVGLAQGLAFLVLAGAAGLHPGLEGYALAFAVLTLSSVGLTALGFCIAWVLDSSQGFHAVSFVVRENHFAHGLQTIFSEKHVLRAAESDTFRSKVTRNFRILRRIGIGSNFKPA